MFTVDEKVFQYSNVFIRFLAALILVSDDNWFVLAILLWLYYKWKTSDINFLISYHGVSEGFVIQTP